MKHLMREKAGLVLGCSAAVLTIFAGSIKAENIYLGEDSEISAFTSSDADLALGQLFTDEEDTENGTVEDPETGKESRNEEASSSEKADEAVSDGPVLDPFVGTVMGPSGKETYYNLDMSGVIDIMRSMGNTDEYHGSENGCKMLGDYIMCAANLDVHPRGSLVQSSLGMCIVCDTGGFAEYDPYQLDIAVTW